MEIIRNCTLVHAQGLLYKTEETNYISQSDDKGTIKKNIQCYKNIQSHRQLIPHHLVQDLQCHHYPPLQYVGRGPRQEMLLVVCLIKCLQFNQYVHSLCRS